MWRWNNTNNKRIEFYFKKIQFSIWLKADVSYCLNNIADNTRPLLQVNKPIKKQLKIYTKSENRFTKSSAHIIIEVQEKSIPQICKIINEKN